MLNNRAIHLRQRNIRSGIREKVFDRDTGICQLCRKPIKDFDFELDHIIPFSLGGPDEAWNLRVTHQQCNKKRHGSLTKTQFPLDLDMDQNPIISVPEAIILWTHECRKCAHRWITLGDLPKMRECHECNRGKAAKRVN